MVSELGAAAQGYVALKERGKRQAMLFAVSM